MKIGVLVAALAAVVLTGPASSLLASETVTGILFTNGFETYVDSTRVSGDTWVRMAPSPEWGGAAGLTDTFQYSEWPGWPVSLKLYARVGGTPAAIIIPSPAPDSWYLFQGYQPTQAPKVMYKRQSGVEEPRSGRLNGLRVAATPNVATGAVTVRATGVVSGPAMLEVYDAAGNRVSSLAVPDARTTLSWRAGDRLPEGIYYFCLTAGGRSAVCKVMLAR